MIAALGTAALRDHGLITDDSKHLIIDRMKVRREKERLGCVLLAERDAKVQNLTCIGFDSKKDPKVPGMCLIQCFGSIFIESGSGSSQKSQSGSGSRKGLNLDPVPSYFLTLSEEEKNLLHYYKFLSSKEVN